MIYEPNHQELTVSDKPSEEQVQQALAVLLDVVSDIPFQKPAHQAAWLLYLLIPLAGYAFSGPAPLFLINANTRGSGKSLLADVVSMIITDHTASRMSNPKDNEECRKQITSLALNGDSFVLLDNIVGSFGCASLDAALTGTRWKDRKLGQSEFVELPLNVTWSASGTDRDYRLKPVGSLRREND